MTAIWHEDRGAEGSPDNSVVSEQDNKGGSLNIRHVDVNTKTSGADKHFLSKQPKPDLSFLLYLTLCSSLRRAAR